MVFSALCSPRELYDAATIDGAASWKRFWHVTLPILTLTLLVALVLRTVDAFRMFDLVAVMTEGDADTTTVAFCNKQVLIDCESVLVLSDARSSHR
jgi:ABC-type sugar transport system permease subunit